MGQQGSGQQRRKRRQQQNPTEHAKILASTTCDQAAAYDDGGDGGEQVFVAHSKTSLSAEGGEEKTNESRAEAGKRVYADQRAADPYPAKSGCNGTVADRVDATSED